MLHDGHRKRIKNKFLEFGLDSFDDHTVLELLLFFSIPRSDTNPTAHMLLEDFGGLSAVFDAPYEELLKSKGIGKSSAALIKLIPHIAERYIVSKSMASFVINTPSQAGEYLAPYFCNELGEVVYMISLDGKGKVLNCRKVFDGSVSSPELRTKKIVESALFDNATAVIMAHNHTNGIALPDDDDIAITRKIDNALKLIDVVLVDHIIAAGDDFISFSDNGYFKSQYRKQDGGKKDEGNNV